MKLNRPNKHKPNHQNAEEYMLWFIKEATLITYEEEKIFEKFIRSRKALNHVAGYVQGKYVVKAPQETDLDDLKKCSKCGEFKDVSEFYKNRTSKDRLFAHCKQCTKQRYKHNQAIKKDKHEWKSEI